MPTALLAAVTVATHPTIPDIATFVVAALIVVGGAVGVIFNRNPVHAALMLVATLFGVAVLFVEQNAQFLAAVQVIVYTGAIVVLILFVIMLLGVDKEEVVISDTFKGQQFYAVFMGLLILAEVLLFAKSNSWVTGAKSTTKALSKNTSNVTQLGQSLFTTYLVPFEATSALLIVAIIGAVVLARRPRKKGLSGPSDSEISIFSTDGTDDGVLGGSGQVFTDQAQTTEEATGLDDAGVNDGETKKDEEEKLEVGQ
ncbi:MAG: NADH-quinone oxidoreductase subunit J [Firmicutes bacterium]|jgi:NADH-quinone oxidoreductase subunit J|nr:NADH-quinone oxidoreductase subunit J [Bacillota bacterium]